ncbi:MAG TPA: AbrB/MazE/SpoVT family DNA-binding domain-containing protein [Microlunatus sp.]|nr:AbrB/MazE/SpoVT family DNA-binding domain-containing protein [Propionibacteriaceae bacterium]HYI53915.1 AbrB/MazE/SpoVT family DNA-binding domain-containing protein [Microlunatus sp.]
MGDRGRLVVPLELRERWNMHAGSALLMIDTPDGIVLATRDQVKRLLREQLQGRSLVDELIADRRAAAAEDDRS